MEMVTIEKEKLQKLLSNFYSMCSLCNEMNISEFPEGDEHMQEMKTWVKENFNKI